MDIEEGITMEILAGLLFCKFRSYVSSRTLAAQNAQKYLEICRLPNDLLRPVALEAFLKPSIPFTVSSVKVVYNPQGFSVFVLLFIIFRYSFGDIATCRK